MVPWRGYAAAKSFALQRCTGEWVLWIDADERVPHALAREIQERLGSGPSVDGFAVPRLAFFMGRWIRHGGWYPGHVLRLFRRERGRFSADAVHEGVVLQGRLGRLKNHLLHYTDLTLEHYVDKLNRYTTLSAQMAVASGKRAGVGQLLFRPAHTFVKMYFLKAGFLDGVQGFMLALLSAGHTFAKYAKVWHAGMRKFPDPAAEARDPEPRSARVLEGGRGESCTLA